VAHRVLISGSLAGHSVGYGRNPWVFLQYVLGFRRLGLTIDYVVSESLAGQLKELANRLDTIQGMVGNGK
jgi:hypothetical protein